MDADDWTVPPDLWADIDCPSDQTDLRLIPVLPPDLQSSVEGSLTVDRVQHPQPNPAGGGIMLGVGSRHGRIIRPVVSLIQNMHQKVLAGF